MFFFRKYIYRLQHFGVVSKMNKWSATLVIMAYFPASALIPDSSAAGDGRPHTLRPTRQAGAAVRSKCPLGN